jgi:hypothetical protein
MLQNTLRLMFNGPDALTKDLSFVILMTLALYDTLIGTNTSVKLRDDLVSNLMGDPVFLLSRRFVIQHKRLGHLGFANTMANVDEDG